MARGSVAVVSVLTLALTAGACSDDGSPTAGPSTAPAPGTPMPSHSLLAKVPEGGTLQVIVTLSWPDNQSPPPSDKEGRAQVVAQVQDELIQALEPYDGAEIRTRFQRNPQLALVVDRQALAFLLTSPLVQSVHEDAVNRAH